MTQRPAALTRTITVLDPDHLQKGREVAKRIAEQTGQTIALLDANGLEIEIIHPTRH